jgi:membrane protease subunit (stomatin/prohibitin family)
MMRDKDFGVVRATAFGLYAIRVKDAGTFVKDLVGTDNRFTTEEIQENLRGKIGLRIKEVMPELGIPVLDLEAKVTELGTRLRERLSPEFEGLGIELVEVQVQDIGLPEEVEKAIDKRGAMAAIGNLQAYAQYETASAIRDAANNPGGAAGAAVGIGAGVAMGAQMINAMGGAAGLGGAPAAGAAVPPPVPGAAGFHVAVNGQQAGPFDLAALQQQAASGSLTRASLVWKAGMAQWVKAGEVPELAPLFANVPPPVPPAS